MSRKRQAPSWLPGVLLLVGLGVRLWWAASAPLANDEAYYWDWSRDLQLSYLDHPPAVAWLAALTTSEILGLLALTELVPAFSLEGVLLLPDGSLLAALAMALYAFLRAADSPKGRSFAWIPLAGLALGLAGLSKYHAAPLACGLAGGLLVYWRTQRRYSEAAVFLAGTAVIAIAVTLPVWIWNAENAWASLRFQGAHGFADLGFTPLAALRVYLGQFVLLTPLVVLYLLSLFKRLWPAAGTRDLRLLGMWAALPLLVLLEVLAFGKQMLPHWLAPCAWMIVPALALHKSPKRLYRLNFAFAALVTWGLPWVLTLKPLRQGLIDSFHGRPGPLSELTLWEPLAQAAVQDTRLGLYLRPRVFDMDKRVFGTDAKSCPGGLKIASLRWFWTAQLAFHLPGQPRVLNLDFNHPSYYSYRDHLPAFADCPVLIIADARHLDTQLLGKALLTWRKLPLRVPSHQDTDVAVLLGRFRSEGELRQLQAEIGPPTSIPTATEPLPEGSPLAPAP